MSGYSVGDKVYIVRPYAGDVGCVFVSEMVHYINDGVEYTIKRISPGLNHRSVYELNNKNDWAWCSDSFEPAGLTRASKEAEAEAVRLEAEAIIRDAMRYRELRKRAGNLFTYRGTQYSGELLIVERLDAAVDEAIAANEVHPKTDSKGVLNETPVAAPAAFRSAGS